MKKLITLMMTAIMGLGSVGVLTPGLASAYNGDGNSNHGDKANRPSIILVQNINRNRTKPRISNITVVNIRNSSVTIKWTTDIPSNSKVFFAQVSKHRFRMGEVHSNALVRYHVITLSGLERNTKYTFYVQSTSFGGRVSASPQRTFNTSGFRSRPR